MCFIHIIYDTSFALLDLQISFLFIYRIESRVRMREREKVRSVMRLMAYVAATFTSIPFLISGFFIVDLYLEHCSRELWDTTIWIIKWLHSLSVVCSSISDERWDWLSVFFDKPLGSIFTSWRDISEDVLCVFMKEFHRKWHMVYCIFWSNTAITEYDH